VNGHSYRIFHNGDSFPVSEVPSFSPTDFAEEITAAVTDGWRISSLFGVPRGKTVELYCVLSFRIDGFMGIMRSTVKDAFPSITPLCPQAHLFEREIAEECGVIPEGHPWLKPVRFQRPIGADLDASGQGSRKEALPGVMEYFRVEGEEIHEVAVGPVHAGIIEPGHFRFQCHGEQVLHLEISLGYQHRGMERGLSGGPHRKTLYQMETVAGDTTIGHTTAYAMILEALAGVWAPARGEALRGIALELERLANHAGDLGAIAGDVGFLLTASFCGRIRGDFLNMTAVLCGSRFGRGLVRPGGVAFDLSIRQRDDLLARLARMRKDMTNAVALLWDTPSVMARLENTGIVTRETAVELGLVGPAARACGLERDVRFDYPYGMYRMSQIPVVTAPTGDVYARAMTRWLESLKSLEFVEEQLQQLPGGACRTDTGAPAGDRVTVAMTEGWRGEICHTAITDGGGRFARYKITDPSFHNWMGLAMAMRNGQISDFPLCNKSFNLSYCGFDL
jgi:Ni,Fe-hydrogenase III large subunit